MLFMNLTILAKKIEKKLLCIFISNCNNNYFLSEQNVT